MLLGLACFFLLPDCPADARWLTTEEREFLEAERLPIAQRQLVFNAA